MSAPPSSSSTDSLAPATGGGVGRRRGFRAAPVDAREGATTALLLLPLPLWLLAGGAGGTLGTIELVALLAVGIALALGLRRLPTPVPYIAALPGGFAWALAVVFLRTGPAALATALLAGCALVLLVAQPSPDELAVPIAAVGAQASVPLIGGLVSFIIALPLLGTSAPLYAEALAPTLGALALAVYLFAREDVVPREPAPAPGAAPPRPPGREV